LGCMTPNTSFEGTLRAAIKMKLSCG
jgi:hypothetical protein